MIKVLMSRSISGIWISFSLCWVKSRSNKFSRFTQF